MIIRAEPLYFGPEDRPRAGWFHRPDRPARDGLVIVPPFGYEAVCAHRSLRHLAGAAAAAGIAALRFDLDGTGDSAGGDRDPGRVRAWLDSVRDAAIELRRLTGADRIWLAGVRLGAMLAALAAREIGAAGLIAIAPVVSGKALLRELRALQMALGLSEPPTDVALPEGGQEALGFTITDETRAELGAIDLTKQTAPPAPHVLVLDREDLPSADKWIARLREQGVDAEAQRVPGYVEMVLDPHRAVVPGAIVAATTAWLRARLEPQADGTVVASGEPRTEARIGEVIERPVFVDRHLFGVLAAPANDRATSGRGVLLLNAGAVHRVGPNRLYVAMARQWAAAGDHVLRLDVSGIGDSPARPGEAENVVYGARALEDVAAAIAWMRRRPGVREVRAVGLCSGAYHAFKAAVAGEPVDGVVVINPLTFFWTPDQPLDFPAFRVAGEAERYGKAAFDRGKWKKLLRGKVNVRNVAQTLARHAASRIVNRARDVSRRVGLPWKDDLGAELETVAERGVDLQFVFAGDDPGLQLLRIQGGSVVPRLRERGALVIRRIERADHTFTPVWSHAPLSSVVTDALSPPPR